MSESNAPPPPSGVRLENILADPALLMAAVENYSDAKARRIALDVVEFGGVTYEVSTVDLFWEHHGGHFETLVSDSDGGTHICRYPTREVAAEGHREILTRLRSGLTP